MKHALPLRSALAERNVAPSSNRFDLLAPVRVLRKALGLTPNDLAVLTALVSFLPRDGVNGISVVFPSNTALANRANGLDERTLRRSLARLSAAGLIARKSSANGKRFPLRHHGVIRDAFGLDLRPLIDQQPRLLAEAAKAKDEAEHLRALRAEAQALRSFLSRRGDLDPDMQATLSTMQSQLRRATLSVDAVLRMIEELRGLANDCTVPDPRTASEEQVEAVKESGVLSGRNGQNDRHKESKQREIREDPEIPRRRTSLLFTRNPRTMDWQDFRNVASYFPCPPRTTETFRKILADLGSLLRIGQDRLARGLRELGAGRTLLVLDYLISRADAIREPNAYFDAVLARDTAGQPS